MNIAITGGHLTPAISFMQHLKGKSDSVLFIGRLYASEQAGIESREKAEVENLGYQFATIPAVKYNRYRPFQSVLKAYRLPLGTLQSLRLLKDNQIDVVLSFGGYLSVPVALAARMLSIPIVVHEQTQAAGLANQLVSNFAHITALSFKESREYFAGKSVKVIGNLIRAEILDPKPPAPEWAKDFPASRPLLYITGGNQGSQIINQVVASLYAQLLKRFIVIHQTGGVGNSQNFEQLNIVKNALPDSLSKKLLLRQWFSAAEVSWLFSHAHVVISRAGANTVTELMVKGAPCLLIPLPGTHQSEQYKNAQKIVSKGGGLLIPQADLTPETLLTALEEMSLRHQTYQKKATQTRSQAVNQAPQKLYSLLKQAMHPS